MPSRIIPPEHVEPFLESANRRHLFGRMEFKVYLFHYWAPSIIFLQGLTSRNVKVIVVALVLWLFLRWAGRAMAKYDPYMTEVYIEALKLRQKGGSLYYPAVSHESRIRIPRVNDATNRRAYQTIPPK